MTDNRVIEFVGQVDYTRPLTELLTSGHLRLSSRCKLSLPEYPETNEEVRLIATPIGSLIDVEILARIPGIKWADPVAVIQICILQGQATLGEHPLLTLFVDKKGQQWYMKLDKSTAGYTETKWICDISPARGMSVGPRWLQVAMAEKRPVVELRDPRTEIISGHGKPRSSFVR